MKRIEYIIDEISMIMENTICLNLVPKNSGNVIKFRSGQYGLISLLKGEVLSAERPFSFASSKDQSESLQFGFRVCGQFTGELAQLKKGDSVFVRGPFGAFIYDESKHKDTVFLAAGIGITPFLSSIRHASEKALPNKMTLIYSNNFINQIPFYDELKKLEAINPNLSTYFLISKDKVDPNQKQFIEGRISTQIFSNILANKVSGKTFFICGPEPFTIAAIDMLKELGVQENNIKTEGFSQTPISFFEKGTAIFPLVAGTSALFMLIAFIMMQIQPTTTQTNSTDQVSSTQVQTVQNSSDEQVVEVQQDTTPVYTPPVYTPPVYTPPVYTPRTHSS